ncbi:hypothetical protein, partial [Pseudomonas viridiflava]|uniref:hypothetical protein n=1 Tax=Pseudomonas viridiflava TaxID=33069 RepID=UPI001981D099
MATHLRHIQVRTRSVLSGIPTRSVGTISVISSTPIMPMLALIIKGLHQQAQHFWHVAHGRQVV